MSVHNHGKRIQHRKRNQRVALKQLSLFPDIGAAGMQSEAVIASSQTLKSSLGFATPSPAGNEALIRNSSPGEQMQMALTLSVMYLEGTTEYHSYDKQGKKIIGNSK